MAYKVLKNQKIEPVKPACRKTIYNSPEEAQAMIRHINETRVTRQIHVYQCNICGKWHLTSKNERF
jgi:hypothetical protein